MYYEIAKIYLRCLMRVSRPNAMKFFTKTYLDISICKVI